MIEMKTFLSHNTLSQKPLLAPIPRKTEEMKMLNEKAEHKNFSVTTFDSGVCSK